MTTTAMMIIIAAVIVVAIAAWFIFRQQRSKKLHSKFGPEYEHAVREFGSSSKAEDALVARQKRLERLHIHTLAPEERERFAEQWHELQSRFVDDPSGSIEAADGLICEVMSARGYPMREFERRAEDLSVDYAQVVSDYRAAHAIALRRDRGEATTEDLRKAMVYYRDLFDELLETHVTQRGNKR